MSYSYLFTFFLFQLISLSFQKKNLLQDSKLNDDDIIIIHTNDVHCAVNTDIGYDGLMLFKKEMQQKYSNVILVDAGDQIQGGTLGFLSNGIDIVKLMNKLDYKAVALGNHEFDYGLDKLKECNDVLDCKYLSANFIRRSTGTTLYDPFTIIKLENGKSIGFIGVTTPQALSKSYLHTLVDEDGNMIYDFLTEGEGQKLCEELQKYIDFLRNIKQVDYVILLAHLGNDGDAIEQYTSKGVLSNINGVDAIIDGHSHRVYNSPLPDKDKKEVIISQVGTKLTRIGVIKISPTKGVTSEIISEVPEPDSTLIDTAEQVTRNGKVRWVDSEMKKEIDEIIKSHEEELNKKIGYTDFDLLMNADRSGDSSKQISRSEESTVCDLVSDALRAIGKGEINLINAGSIRTDIYKGTITYNNVIEVLPFNAEIILKQIKGQDILDALEFGVMNLPGKSPRFLQVSGISFKVDMSIKSPVVIDQEEMFVRVDGARRVSDVKVGNNQLDPNREYLLSFDNYIGNGGDGFSMFSKYPEINSTTYTDNQALKKYIMEDLKGVIPDIYRYAQGRIQIKGKEKEKEDTTHSSMLKTNLINKIFMIISILLVLG